MIKRKAPADREKYLTLSFLILLSLAAFLPYIPLLSAGFVNWDDDIYVTSNVRVLKGVTIENIKWAFSAISFGFYYPITWISHMLDVSIYGLRPWGHHLTSMLIHASNVLLLFFFLKRAGIDQTRSFLISMLFAVHPLNAESVSWISERKNLLAAFFFFAALNFYLAYLKKPCWQFISALWAAYLLGLMSKSVIVTFPVVLYLVDVWPLGRTKLEWRFILNNWKRLILEKLLLFLPVPIFAALTIIGQSRLNTLASFEKIPPDERIAGALLAYGRYLWQFVFPLHLTTFFPHLRDGYSVPALVLSIAVLAALSTAAALLMKKSPLYIVCLSWFFVNLLPVIGILQVGGQGSADRYMYIPMVGLLAISVFGLFALFDNFPAVKPKLVHLFFLAAALLFSAKSWERASVWRDSETLFNDMIVTSPNPSHGYLQMGLEFKQKSDFNKAIEYYKKAIAADPRKAEAYNNMGNCYYELKDIAAAKEAYEKACSLNRESPFMFLNLAMAEELIGDPKRAETFYLKSLSIDPAKKASRVQFIRFLRKQGRFEDALLQCREGMKFMDDEVEFPRLRGGILINMKKFREAKTSSEEGLKKFPGDGVLLGILGESCFSLGESSEAQSALLGALAVNPGDPDVLMRLADISLSRGDREHAIDYLKKGAAANPDNNALSAKLESLIQEKKKNE